MPSERLQGKTELHLEEVIGMILKHARHLAEAYCREEIKEVYFSFPVWWTTTERQVLTNSDKLAGFLVSDLASENTGTEGTML